MIVKTDGSFAALLSITDTGAAGHQVSRGDLEGEGDQARHHQRPDQAQVELCPGPRTVSTR